LEHLYVVLQGEQRQGFAFGQRLGQCIEDPSRFIDQAVKVLGSLNRESANASVLASFLGSVKTRDAELVQRTLDAVANDPNLRHHLVDLTRLAKPALSDLQRVLRLVETGCLPVGDLKIFAYSSVLDQLPPNDVIAFTDEMLAYDSVGAWTALDILSLYQHGDVERWNACKHQLRKTLMHSGVNFVDQFIMADLYHWQVVANKLLEEKDAELAQALMTKILTACTVIRSSLGGDDVFQPVLKSLLEYHRDAVWPLLSDALLSDDIVAVHGISNLIGNRFKKEESPGVLFTLPNEFLLEWCQTHPRTAPAVLARIMPLFQPEGENWAWRPLARTIIDRYGGQEAVLSGFTANLGTHSGWGSLEPIRKVQRLER
jgi:hypothetical protein